jgi:hypothetical protein
MGRDCRFVTVNSQLTEAPVHPRFSGHLALVTAEPQCPPIADWAIPVPRPCATSRPRQGLSPTVSSFSPQNPFWALGRGACR